MAPVAYIEHQIPGRVRLRIPEKRGDVGFFQDLIAVLAKHPLVKELDGSPLIGSVRIRHSGSVEAITAMGAERGLFEIGKQEPKAASKPRQSVTDASAGDAGMLDSMATGLSGLAMVQVARGELTGSAAENFWNAYSAQRVLGSKELVTVFAILGVYQLLQGQWLGSASSLFFYGLAARKLAAFDRAAGAFASRGGPPKSAAAKRSAAKSGKGSGAAS
jgi:hypothetical protein